MTLHPTVNHGDVDRQVLILQADLLMPHIFLCSTGMALANLGYLPPHPPEVNHVFKYILPLAIPMLLLSANIPRILSGTGKLLPAFLLGSACTVAGSLVAMAAFPLICLGDDGWRIAAALTARHIGGAVNYMAVSESLSIAPSTFGAGLAADDLILTLYFTTIYTLAKAIPPELTGGMSQADGTSISNASVPDNSLASPSNNVMISSSETTNTSSSSGSYATASSSSHGSASAGRVISVPHGMMAVAISATICYLGTQIATAMHVSSQSITIITGLTVMAATAFPHLLAPLAPSAEGLAMILMQVGVAAC